MSCNGSEAERIGDCYGCRRASGSLHECTPEVQAAIAAQICLSSSHAQHAGTHAHAPTPPAGPCVRYFFDSGACLFLMSPCPCPLTQLVLTAGEESIHSGRVSARYLSWPVPCTLPPPGLTLFPMSPSSSLPHIMTPYSTTPYRRNQGACGSPRLSPDRLFRMTVAARSGTAWRMLPTGTRPYSRDWAEARFLHRQAPGPQTR